MPPFTPDSPFWEQGSQDELMAKFETEAAAQEIKDLVRSMRAHGPSALDVGAGSGFWTPAILKGIVPTKRAACDLHPSPATATTPKVERGDVLELPYADNAFTIVHARRVLSNVPVTHRRQALSELLRVAANWVVVVDVHAEPRRRVELAREQSGLPLPPGAFGVAPLEPWSSALPWNEYAVAPEYYIWTRLAYPIQTGYDCPYGAAELRLAYPSYPKKVCHDYGVHRLSVFSAR